jgi:hypothetical protein
MVLDPCPSGVSREKRRISDRFGDPALPENKIVIGAARISLIIAMQQCVIRMNKITSVTLLSILTS